MCSSRQILTILRETEDFRESSNELKIVQGIFNIQISFFIYRENYRLLKRNLKSNYNDIETITSNNQKRAHFQKKIIKDLHNTITSARSFLEYFDKEKSFLENDFHCFMKELRNYLVHQDHIPLISKLKYNQLEQKRFESFNTFFFNEYLDKQIEEYPKRNGLKKAKLFIHKIGNEPSLNEILTSYDEKLNEFYKKLIMNIISAYYTALKNLVQEINSLNIKLKNCNLNIDTHSPLTEAKLKYLKLLLKNKETA
ncbi:hypothetical protein NO995_06905 [Aestuariibaculum sp. M13]|uniref:hypothetical protein n=1 Tax=Aestuariibaculum sp. M13 TaxID=2967132 RepID=UPI002159E9C6|nr:hypothetical protein [Aestuariibaculum sp. M13]MCR8667402.1 hypothetical protein [Aestuariibaculum sp. M13]